MFHLLYLLLILYFLFHCLAAQIMSYLVLVISSSLAGIVIVSVTHITSLYVVATNTFPVFIL